MRRIIKPKIIPARKLAETLADEGWALNQELTQQKNEVMSRRTPDPVYLHTDGRVLWIPSLSDNHGRLFPSREEFDYLIRQSLSMRSLPYGMHLLTYPDFDGEKAFLISLLPQGADFIAHIPALIEQLPDVLPVPKDALDFSLDSLKHFDHAIRKVGITNCYSPIIIPPMIAYGGEVLRRATHSEWEMRQPRDFPNVWEPWLRDKRGIYRAPWYAVVSALDKPPISIAGDLQFELRSPRIPTGNSSPDSTPYDTIYLTSASAATPAPDSSPAPAPKPAD